MDEIETSGKIMPGSRVELGRLGLGVAVRDGTAAPDLSTPEAFKQALIHAKAIACTDPKLGGVSVLHPMKLADQFGIRDAVTRKGILSTGGNDAVTKVARGEADIAVVLVSEIHIKGAHLAALLPEPIQLWSVYAAAIPASSKDPESARAFIAALTSSAARERWLAAGWQPLGR